MCIEFLPERWDGRSHTLPSVLTKISREMQVYQEFAGQRGRVLIYGDDQPGVPQLVRTPDKLRRAS